MICCRSASKTSSNDQNLCLGRQVFGGTVTVKMVELRALEWEKRGRRRHSHELLAALRADKDPQVLCEAPGSPRGFTMWALTSGDEQRAKGYVSASKLDIPSENLVSCDLLRACREHESPICMLTGCLRRKPAKSCCLQACPQEAGRRRADVGCSSSHMRQNHGKAQGMSVDSLG